MEKIEFDEMLSSIAEENQEFIKELHEDLLKLGCRIDIKLAKSGYMAAYLYGKKTIANYVFRKKGMLVRIYGSHVKEYEADLEGLPEEMIQDIAHAQDCKRMINPASCNQKCPMGYDFYIKGEHYQKCRNSAFFFLICPKHHAYIRSILIQEATACQ